MQTYAILCIVGLLAWFVFKLVKIGENLNESKHEKNTNKLHEQANQNKGRPIRSSSSVRKRLRRK